MFSALQHTHRTPNYKVGSSYIIVVISAIEFQKIVYRMNSKISSSKSVITCFKLKNKSAVSLMVANAIIIEVPRRVSVSQALCWKI